jgi:hypothetical protein
LPPSLEQLVNLVGGEPAAPQQFARQRLRISKPPLEIATDLVELRRFQQAMAPECIDEIDGGGQRHDEEPGPVESRGWIVTVES